MNFRQYHRRIVNGLQDVAADSDVERHVFEPQRHSVAMLEAHALAELRIARGRDRDGVSRDRYR